MSIAGLKTFCKLLFGGFSESLLDVPISVVNFFDVALVGVPSLLLVVLRSCR